VVNVVPREPLRALVRRVGEPAKTPSLDEVDAGWESEDLDEDADEDIDAGWDDPEPSDALDSAASTPEEREARAARSAARKQRLRAKATEKAERRKARASVAAAKQKQKKSSPRAGSARPVRPADPPVSKRESREDAGKVPVSHALERITPPAGASRRRRFQPATLAVIGVVVVLGGVAAFLASR
jgi:hypothetical protein